MLVRKYWSLLLAIAVLSGCVEATVTSTSERRINGEIVTATISSNNVSRILALSFDGNQRCQGEYTGSALVAVQTVSLRCDNNMTGAAEVDATKDAGFAQIQFNIPEFRKGSLRLALNDSPRQEVQTAAAITSANMVENYKGIGDPGPIKPIAGPYPRNYKTAVRSYFIEVLNDPYSFKDGTISKPYYIGRLFPSWIICVKGRTKNGFGAYTGLKYFKVLMRDGKVLPAHTTEGKDASWCNRRDGKLETQVFSLY